MSAIFTWSPSESKNDALESNPGKSFSVLSQPFSSSSSKPAPIWGSPAAKKLKFPFPPVLKVLTSENASPLENLYIYSVSGSNPSKVTWLLEYPGRFVFSITVASRTFASLKSFSAFSFANSNFPFSFVFAYHVKFLSVPSFPIVNISFVNLTSSSVEDVPLSTSGVTSSDALLSSSFGVASLDASLTSLGVTSFDASLTSSFGVPSFDWASSSAASTTFVLNLISLPSNPNPNGENTETNISIAKNKLNLLFIIYLLFS